MAPEVFLHHRHHFGGLQVSGDGHDDVRWNVILGVKGGLLQVALIWLSSDMPADVLAGDTGARRRPSPGKLLDELARKGC